MITVTATLTCDVCGETAPGRLIFKGGAGAVGAGLYGIFSLGAPAFSVRYDMVESDARKWTLVEAGNTVDLEDKLVCSVGCREQVIKPPPAPAPEVKTP